MLYKSPCEREPVTELGAFSSPTARPTDWAMARAGLRDAPLYWLATVRPDRRPHVTPLIGIWLVEGGDITMGSPGGGLGEGPPFVVEVGSFYVGKNILRNQSLPCAVNGVVFVFRFCPSHVANVNRGSV